MLPNVFWLMLIKRNQNLFCEDVLVLRNKLNLLKKLCKMSCDIYGAT